MTIAHVVGLIGLDMAIDARQRFALPANGGIGSRGNVRAALGDTTLMEQAWTFAELSAALERYQAQAEASSLALPTKHTYVVHARRFVDWLGGGYQFPTEDTPGRHRVT